MMFSKLNVHVKIKVELYNTNKQLNKCNVKMIKLLEKFIRINLGYGTVFSYMTKKHTANYKVIVIKILYFLK